MGNPYCFGIANMGQSSGRQWHCCWSDGGGGEGRLATAAQPAMKGGKDRGEGVGLARYSHDRIEGVTSRLGDVSIGREQCAVVGLVCRR